MKKLLLFLPILSLLLVGACKKDSQPTKMEMLTAKNWKISVYTVDPSLPVTDGGGNIIGYTSDMLAQMEDCSKDDLTKFNTDGVMINDEGATKCDPASPQTTTGTWLFNTDQTILTVNSGNNPVSYDILELSSSTLKMKTVENLFGTNYTLTLTFKSN
ncbi:MAG: lipocalin family protein [Bacteroidetes bacterium]|nr:lipocalin family protein [Bacteroidota bacterium]